MGVTLGPRQPASLTPTLKTRPTATTATTSLPSPATGEKPVALWSSTPPDVFDGVAVPKKAASQTVGDVVTLAHRRLLPLRDALVDPQFPTRSLASIPVPGDVVDVLTTAKKILVIGHARPADGDCVGSALGLMRGLNALGKEATAVVDQDLPASLRALDPEQQLRRARDVFGQDFDLVVLVDVAQAGRTGDMVDVVKGAKNVLVIDHHDEPNARTALGLADGARLTSWIDVDFDAAAAQVGAAVHAVAKASGGDVDAAVNQAVNAAAFVVAAGLYTDTLGFKAPGADSATMSLFKGLAVDVLGAGSLANGLSILDTLEGRLAARLPEAVSTRLDEAVVVREKRGALGAERVLGVHGSVVDDALATLQQTDPRAVVGDVNGVFLDALDDARSKPGSGHALLVMPGDDHGWRVSIRGEAALDIGRRLSKDGGGKPGAAVALLTKAQAATLDDAMALAEKALSDQMLTTASLMRVGR